MLVKWEYVRVRRKKIENSVGSFLNFLRKKRLFKISSNTYFLKGVLSDIKSFFFFFSWYTEEKLFLKKGLSDFFLFNGYRHFSTRFCKQLKWFYSFFFFSFAS